MLSYRKFNKESDYNIMLNIVKDNCRQTGHLYPQLHIGNLDFERYAFQQSPDILYDTIWFVSYEDIEIGFITVEEDEFYITILSKFENLKNDILDFIEHNCYDNGSIITTEANSEDTLMSNTLEKRGYIKTGNFRFSGICKLSKIPSNIPLPNGFTIRQTMKKDTKIRAELFGLATGGIGTTSERYEKMMNSKSYCNDLDLVVQTDDGEIIAYCTIWDDPNSKIAILEPVACVEEYRRRGIMKSTLLYGLNIIKKRGTKYIYVGTGGNNVASQALYRSVGFVEYGKNHEWQKTL